MTDSILFTPLAGSALQSEVAERFGVLPNFFRLAPETPEITANLWGFAKFGYLDNPLPSLFKERLFVYLSRFCEVRYCITRHVGFLVGLGRPAGDKECPPQTVDEVAKLIRKPLSDEPSLARLLSFLETGSDCFPPKADTTEEEAVFACATHVFLQTTQAARCLAALRGVCSASQLQHLVVFLTFVRAAHFWTRVHPELELESDVRELLDAHEMLAQCVLNDPKSAGPELTQVLLDELTSLRRERALREDLERANLALRETEELLREQDRRKDEWLATLAHELRNPLAPIRSGVELMRRLPDLESATKTSAMIERQLSQLVRLVDDLLDVSRISRGKIELKKERVELASVVYHAVEAARAVSAGLERQLTITLPHRPVYLEVDPTRLTQVVVNLLNNAAKFSEPGSSIRLSAECDERHAIIRIQDDGIGIEADHLQQIFELFSQVDTSLERSRSGLGIGLTLVKRLIELHDGEIEARSEGLGRGSEFILRLPIAYAIPEISQVVESPLATDASQLQILVVDDNRDAADSLGMLLSLSGHKVHLAHDGATAVEMASALSPHVVVLDIGLPVLNGYEVATKIRRHGMNPKLLLVALTGWGQEDDRKRSKEAGFDHHLLKPVDFSALNLILTKHSQQLRLHGHPGTDRTA
jgi:signal transduction histidine kinase/ActR/RegA family two-component response regulator